MKAIIENQLENFSCEASIIFVEIINAITGSENENHLRFAFKVLESTYSDFSDYFEYGFGSSHMWLKERGNSKRLIFVEF